MKGINILAIAALLTITATSAFAQYPAEFTKDQADSTITLRRSEISRHESDLRAAQAELGRLNSDIQTRMASISSCQQALYSMLGSDRNGYNAYRERIVRAEQELAALRSSNPATVSQDRVKSLENDIRGLRGDKLVLIRDHKTRVTALSNGYIMMKRSMVPPNMIYTVGTWRENRDCLWNIAKKPEIYNDPFAWPKIWRANMEQIRNPDVIHPGQQLTVMKTEVTPEDRDATGYRRRR